MIIEVTSDGWLSYDGHRVRCALGRAGIHTEKREGDGVTPRGDFAFRRVLYRTDRTSRPDTALPITAIEPEDGWCDDPKDPAYNQQVKRPFAASHERLWLDEPLYDLIVVLGHNDDPVIPGKGSAIFLHVAQENFGPTEGCVAISIDDLRALVAAADSSTILRVL